MSSAAHELMIDLLGKTPDVVHELLGPRPNEHLTSATATAITDIEEAKRSPVRAFVSGIVHGKSMTAVPIGLALAHALEASHDDDLASHWDTFLAALSEPVRKELEMQLEQHHRLPRSDWGRKFYDDGEAKGRAEGRASAVVSLLVFRGVGVGREHRERILACTDLTLLDQWLLRAATAGSIDDVFAHQSP